MCPSYGSCHGEATASALVAATAPASARLVVVCRSACLDPTHFTVGAAHTQSFCTKRISGQHWALRSSELCVRLCSARGTCGTHHRWLSWMLQVDEMEETSGSSSATGCHLHLACLRANPSDCRARVKTIKSGH